MTDRYQRPGWFTRHVFNPAVAGLTRLGISVLGSRVLEVTGRKSGQARRTPVNLLTLDGTEYLVAPRGETEWVRNVRAADGHLALLVGRSATNGSPPRWSTPTRSRPAGLPEALEGRGRRVLRRRRSRLDRRGAGRDRPPPPGVPAQLRAATRAWTRPGMVWRSATEVTARPAAVAAAAVIGPMHTTTGGHRRRAPAGLDQTRSPPTPT